MAKRKHFCINLTKFLLITLCKWFGLELLPEGCRAIPAGHFNFDPAVARQMGGRDAVTQAIIYEKINGWLLHYEKRGRDYVYNNIDQWAEQIPFWHKGTIRRHIHELVECGLLDRQRSKINAPSSYKKPVTKESDGANQMLLWGDEKSLTVATKESDSSIHNPAIHQPATDKQPTPAPVRARAPKPHNVGVVATFPGMGEKDQDLPEPKPQAAEARPGNEDFDQADDANTTPPLPLPEHREGVEAPPYLVKFFTGCTPHEVADLVARYGEPMLQNAKMFAESSAGVKNPPGYVRAKLAQGWRPPERKPVFGEPGYYKTSQFADFVMS